MEPLPFAIGLILMSVLGWAWIHLAGAAWINASSKPKPIRGVVGVLLGVVSAAMLMSPGFWVGALFHGHRKLGETGGHPHWEAFADLMDGRTAQPRLHA